MGTLRAERGPGGEVVLDFPRLDPVPATQTPAQMSALLGVPVHEVFSVDAGNWSVFAVLDSALAVQSLVPDFARLGQIDDLVVTARGQEVDFVSRCFAPGMGLPEDPVTGSTHSTLAPYWSARLGKTTLLARQVSARGGELRCEVLDQRVRVSGQAVLYAEGQVRAHG
jgi:predicted PhzF superfamily epimerase YddE/YHI9